MDKDDVYSAVYNGRPITCTEEQYPEIRNWLFDCAGFWNDQGEGLRQFVALNEVKRLDQFFEVAERTA